MPGGNKNIDGKVDGKQFSKDYQPAEKWTEEKALEMGQELLDWLDIPTIEGEANNVFIDDFLYIEKGYYTTLFNYLMKKFSSVSSLHKVAKKKQEMKLAKLGLTSKFNPAITKFVLTNHHDYKDKIDQRIIDSAPIVQIVDVRGKEIDEEKR